MVVRQRPGAALRGLVQCFWHSEQQVVEHPSERCLPSGATSLVIRLTGPPLRILGTDRTAVAQTFRDSVVWGPQSSFVVRDTARKGSVAGVQFRPGAAAALLATPGRDLTDRHVSLEDLWGARARQLQEQLRGAESSDGLFSLLEQCLIARLKRPLLMHPAIAYALREMAARPSVARIGEIRRETGYSPKRFIELFVQSVGLTPKLYSRIQRFQAVLWTLACGEPVNWADVALDGGYCDQPHLHRDFRAFAGLPLGAYKPISRDRPHHVPIQAEQSPWPARW